MKFEKIPIYRNGEIIAYASKIKWQDTVMGQQYVSTDIESEYPIDWKSGDYLTYRGQTYTISVAPTAEQSARPFATGNAFKYDGIKFFSEGDKLSRIDMLDITPTTGDYIAAVGTNYTGSSQFQLFCGETTQTIGGKKVVYPPVCTLAGKIQANLDRAFPKDGWKVLVDTTSTHKVNNKDILNTHTDDKTLSYNCQKVSKALQDVHDIFDLDYCVNGRTIYIGYTFDAVTQDGDDMFYLGHGSGYADINHQGEGLFKIKRTSNADQMIVTRLRALGSKKNMPYRYYNKRYPNLPQSMFPLNLQLPDTFETEDVKKKNSEARKYTYPDVRFVNGDTNDAYIDKNDDAPNCEEGLREASALWDGSSQDLEEIYPSIKEVTYGELRGNCVNDIDGGSSALPSTGFPRYDNDERVDEILNVGDDANIGDGILAENKTDSQTKSIISCELPTSSVSEDDFSAHQDRFNTQDIDFFEVGEVAAGNYILSPNNGHVQMLIAAHNNVNPVKVAYNIIVYAESVDTGKRTPIATWWSKYIGTLYDGMSCSQVLPSLPDKNKDDISKGNSGMTQVSHITVKERSRIYVKLQIAVDGLPSREQEDLEGTSDALTLDYKVYKGDNVDSKYKCEYIWDMENSASTFMNTPFTVIIKDFGVQDLQACFNSGDTPVISMTSGRCVGREFTISDNPEKVSFEDGGRSVRGWKLTLSRAQDSTLNTYYPSSVDTLEKEDHFVLLGITMPDAYVKAAEMRLLIAASQYLADNCETKYTYQPEIDEIYLAQNYDNAVKAGTPEKSIYWNLYAGLKFPFYSIPKSKDDSPKNNLVNITIQSVTITEGEGLIPTVDLTLNDDLEQSTQEKITASIDRIYNGSIFNNSGSGGNAASTIANIRSQIRELGGELFLSRLNPDTASGLITFLQGMALGSDGQWNLDKDGVGKLYQMFLSGESNGVQASNLLSSNFNQAAKTGYWVTDDDGTKYSYMEIDKLYVRYKAVFDELEIRKRTYVGGNAMFSDAASKIVGVEWLDKAGNTTTDITKIHDFKCHLKTDDGTTQTQNLWRVNDLALCQTFNIKEGTPSGAQNKAYWRKVTAVGDDYIWLSNVKDEYEGFDVDHTADAANYGTSAKVVLAGADGVVSDGDVLTDGADGMAVPADFPEAEDAIVQCGNTSDATRQNMIELLTYTPNTNSVLYGGGAAPALIQYAGINSFTLNGKAKTVISPSGNVFRAKSFIIELGDDTSVHVPLDMGEWKQGTEYPYYARVSHKGELWLLNGIDEDGTTNEEPGTKNAWTRQVAKGKDGDGLNVKGTVVEHFKNFADFDANVKERPKEGEEDPHFVLVSGRVVGMNSAIIVDSAADYSEDHDGDIQQGTAKPSILTYTNDPIYDWDVAEASEADGYMDADGVLWVAGKTQWTEAGTIKGEKGDKGDDAEWYEVEAYVSGGGIISSVSTDKDGKPKLSSFAVRLVRHVGNRGTAVPSKWSVPSQKEYGVTSVAGGVFALVQYGTLTIGEMTITATYNGKEYTKSIPVVKDGQTGDKGDDGEDAIDVLISPETLMFDTDDDGKLSGAQKAYISLRKGGTLLKPETDYTISQKTEGVNVEAEGITLDNTEQGYTITIDPTHITTYDIVDEQGNKTTYPYTDGYVAMVINVGGSLNLTKRVMFRVNYAKYVGRVSWTQKQFESKFEKTTTDMNGSITQMKSDIKQNADSISLVVTEDGAKQSGMLIRKDGTTLMGKKIKLDNGGESVPLVLEDGKLNADLIEVTHLYAKDNQGNVIGYLGDPTGEHTKVTENSNIIHYAPLYVGGKDAAHSAFRVYSDGITHLEKAQIVGGTVGGFTATDSSLVIGGDTLIVDDKGNPILDKNGNKQYEQHDRMSLTAGAITFNSEDRTIMASFGNASGNSTSGWEQFPLNISKKRDYTQYEQGRRNIGIMIDVEGKMEAKSTDDWGNHALYIMHGDIYGFRLRHRVMDSSNDTMQIMNGDCNITIYGWNNTLIMPKFPEDGMTVFVRNHSTKNSTLMQCSYTDDEKKTHPDAVAATLEWVKDIGANQYQMQTGLTSLTVLPGRYMILTYCGVKNIWMGGQFMN